MEGGAATMEAILSSASGVVTAGLGWLTETAQTVVGEPLLLMFLTVGFIGTGISLMRRIIG